MKNLAVTLTPICLSLIFVGALTGISSAEINKDAILGVWFFDESTGQTAKDSSGNGRDGELLGKTKWTKGEFSNALEFPGSSDSYVSVPHDKSLNLVTWTATAWVNMQPGDWQGILVKSKKPGAADRNYGIWTWTGSGELWAQSHFPAAATAQGTTVITDGDWYHVAGTYDQKAVRAYVNGELEKEVAAAGNPVTNDEPLTIGAASAGDFPTKGVIDDVGLFNIALTEADIKSIMTGGLAKTLGLTAVSASGKLTTVWGRIKTEN